MAAIERMHTAEHLLSAVMRIHFQAPRNLEFHLGEKKTKCDYAPAKIVDDHVVLRIERLVNAEIQKNHRVSDFVVRREDAGAYDLWKVPREADTIRIVKIGDLDAQPCAGKHVQQTSAIGTFHIISHEQRENGRLRLRFRLEP